MADRGKRRRRTRRRNTRSQSLLPTICKYAMGIIVALSVQTAEAQETYLLIPRNYTGIGNNVANPSWGAVGTTQIRSVAGAYYETDGITPPGALRPSARELMSEVFLGSTPSTSSRSVLFIAWGQLLCFDMHLNVDNTSEPFDVPCNDGGGGLVDIWCPQGAASEDIPFFRSDAAFATDSGSDSGSDSDSVRNPVNYATAYIDLDFVYGRSEGEAEALRTMEGGLMNVTGTGVPFRNADGTWLIADQRTAQFPVTFALHIMFLLEHNRCCIDVAPQLDYEGDEDIYQACRAWTIALFQHVSENDYFIRLLGTSVASLDDNPGDYTSTNTTTTTTASNSVPPPSSSDGEGQSGTRRARALRKTEGEASREDGRGGGDASASLLEASGGGGGSVDRGSALNSRSTPLVNHRDDGNDDSNAKGRRRSRSRSRGQSRSRRLYALADYEPDVNPAADVFALTMGAAAFESAIPSTVRVVSEGYLPTAYDGIELTVARENMDTLFQQPGIVEDVLRGAVLSPALEIDTCYSAALSNLSPLFKLPVDAVQRGRDHGLPTYNAARLAYDLAAATNFSDLTKDEELASILSDAHGGDIDNLDAITGALAEGTNPPSGDVLEALLVAAWSEQLLRSLLGDRFHHLHSRPIEDVKNTTLAQVLNRAVNLTDLPLSVFDVPGVVVCGGNCEVVGTRNVTLSDSFKLAWESEDDILEITLQAKGIGSAGMLGIGFGGLTMATAQDFIICEVTSEVTGRCIDRQPTTSRSTPEADTKYSELNVTMVDVEGEWTTIKFQRELETLDPDQDYDLSEDIETAGAQTLVIYSYRRGEGVGQHPNANRGAASVNFLTGEVDEKCDDNDFVSLHGAMMLIAWLLLAPWGIYYIRYRKGETVAWAGYEWYEIHQEIMILAAEAVLPLGITAVFASGGNHTTSHAHWGYYMITAVFLQLFTGWMRTKGLEAKHANFSFLHRVNKHFHIWAGRFAYLAGVVQCYRGLELVASSDELVFSAGDGLDLQLGSFGWMKDIVFPIWLGFMMLCFICLESRKQYRRYFAKGAANVCGFMEVINEDHALTKDKVKDRLVPRTEDLPIYTMAEFNDKVLNGQSWALVDGAILDVSNFSQRHPGGARLILNAVGTDVTHELLGQDLSVGHAMSFSPHVHPRSAWEIVHSLVVGYVEEDDEEASQWERDEKARSVTVKADGTRFRVAGKEVLLMGTMGTRGSLTGDNLANKAKRLNDIAAIPDVLPSPESSGQELPGTALPRSVPPAGRKELDHPVRKIARSPTGSKRLLEQFHVCPLLFREKMGVSSDIGRGDLPTTRPVYKYIFSCPGQAQALVRAVTGVCYFNMRAFDPKKGLIQRSYNAFAVRVLDTAPATPGGGVKGGGGTGAGTRTVTPARQTDAGCLCIEMRIRLYRDGAMSQLLEELAKATDNPAVQLQGPFIIQKLVPPPAHRNVVMIAAGTGINPMVQQMRDYQALSNSRDKTVCAKSRLVLVWQCVNESELYGGDEITAMQAKSNGLMEVTLLISGDQRRRNIPGAAFMKAKEKMLMGARALLSPAFSSPSNSVHIGRSQQGGNDAAVISQHGSIHENEVASHGLDAGRVPSFGGLSRHRPSLSNNLSEDRSRGRKRGGQRRVFSKHLERDNSSTTSGLNRGKVNRDIIETAFGDCLMTTLDEYNDELTSTTKRGGSGGGGGGGGGSGDKESESEQKAGDTASDSSFCGIGDGGLEALVGDEETGGKLQVVVSGPSGFVFHVETLLAEMGVPSAAIVLLD